MASVIDGSVYGCHDAGPTSLICIATFCVPLVAQPAVNQSSTFRGSVPLTKISFVENGVSPDGRSPEPYPPNAPGAVTTFASTMFTGPVQSLARKSGQISLM